MRLLRNIGTDRGIDHLLRWLTQGASVDVVSPSFSLWAFAELKDALDQVDRCRLLLGEPESIAPALLGGDADIVFRSQLQARWLARLAGDWIGTRAEIRHARKAPPQSLILVRDKTSARQAMMGTCSFTTEGLGLIPGGQLGLVQATDTSAEAPGFAEWFASNWEDLAGGTCGSAYILGPLEDMAAQRAPSLVYFQILYISVIALWLGHESIQTTHIYIEADLATKQRALGKLEPAGTTARRYKPADQVLAFLATL